MAIKTFQPYVDISIDPHVRTLFNLVFNKINNHALAISNVAKKTGSSITNTTVVESGSSGGGGGGGGVIFGVNNQTGQTAYATTSSDDGVFLILSDAAPIAVSLNSGVPAPFGLFVLNQGAGTATLTPTSGTINGAASLTLLGGYGTTIAFDGGNWFALTQIFPVDTPATSHEFFTAYNSSTGSFTAAQPVAADVVPASSTTVGRPAGVSVGFMDFDTDLGIPIWWNGTAWVNASGVVV